MPRTLSASDRSSLIRLASSLPAGSIEKRAILAGLQKTHRASGVEQVFTEAQAKKAVELAKWFESLGSTAPERSKTSFRAREAGEDYPYWGTAGGGYFQPSPTAKQKNWKWLADVGMKPGKKYLRIAAKGADVAVWAQSRAEGTQPVWESSFGAALRIQA